MSLIRDDSCPCAVMAFARDVGELQSLSGVDLKLIALTHTLERSAHGDLHLRSSAPTPKVHAKMHKTPGKLPGWGTEGADWDALDKEPEDRPTGDRGTDVCTLHMYMRIINVNCLESCSRTHGMLPEC